MFGFTMGTLIVAGIVLALAIYLFTRWVVVVGATEIAKHEAEQMQERAKGDAMMIETIATAEAAKLQKIGQADAAVILSKGRAQAEAYQKQVEALTANGVAMVEVMKLVTDAKLSITPEIVVGGDGNSGNAGLVQLLMTQMLQKKTQS